eukprot:TRINITY_DN1188_c4_g1_i1.p1 TRINITY_DN1188_c4_g1~~TRINITY_DN1188_c4_g1_i1.p1  ORF type:complete len:520 (+),score=88.74 TRINITY_DN1188_c4_g1_i1:61-1620(+)
MRHASARPPPLVPVTSPPPSSVSSASPTTSRGDRRRDSLPYVKDYFTESYKANSRNEDRYLIDTSCDEYHLFGVFDGHGGTECSKYVEQNVADFVRKERNGFDGPVDWPLIISNSLIKLDMLFIKLHAKTYPTKGSCVIMCIVTSDRIYTACIGDSRAVLCRRIPSETGECSIEALPLSEDQDCKNEKEVTAVKNRSTDPMPIRLGKDQMNMRVAGSLMVTRAVGDSYLKNQSHSFPPYVAHLPYITSAPIISEHSVQKDTDLSIVLGSDGLYNLLPNDEIANIVTRHYTAPAKELLNSSLEKVAAAQGITTRMLHQKLCGPKRRSIHDDITILVVQLGGNEIVDTIKSCIMCSDTTNQEMEMRSGTSSPPPDISEYWGRESSCISLPEIPEAIEDDEQEDSLTLSQQSKASTGSGRADVQTPKERTRAGAGTSSFLKALARRRSNKAASASPPPRMPSISPSLPQPDTPTVPSSATEKRSAADANIAPEVKRKKPEPQPPAPVTVWKPPLKQSTRRTS